MPLSLKHQYFCDCIITMLLLIGITENIILVHQWYLERKHKDKMMCFAKLDKIKHSNIKFGKRCFYIDEGHYQLALDYLQKNRLFNR